MSITILRSHRLGPWYGHWHPTSKKWQAKSGLWDRGKATDVKKTWSLRPRYGHWRTGEKPEHWRPSSIKTSHYWWRTDAGVKIVTFQIAANKAAWNGRKWIQLFNVWHPSQEKKSWIPFLPVCAIVFAAIQKVTNSNTGVGRPSIRGSFNGWRTPAFSFFIRSGSDHTSVSRTRFF